MSKDLTIKSHKGKYSVSFNSKGLIELNRNPIKDALYIIDREIVSLYSSSLNNIISLNRSLIIEATEKNKSLNKFPGYVDSLLKLGIKRDQPLVAIGGGITQDIACFLASTMMRGLSWVYLPSTLLSQADSCIGSKSSINSGKVKNILGTFYPPKEIILDITFLKTLKKEDILSGLGEMLKVHAIDSPKSFDKISEFYLELLGDIKLMEHFIHQSLLMKKELIEKDEFDLGPRNVMNYGHSFGHAIESATNYSFPHGIAVTIGMDMANFVAFKLGETDNSHFKRMHEVLNKNAKTYRKKKISSNLLLQALSKDKKNTKSQLRLILPNKDGVIGMGLHDNSLDLQKAVKEYCQLFHG